MEEGNDNGSTPMVEIKIGANAVEEDQNPSKANAWKNASFCGKLDIIRKNITVEPMLACYIMPSALARLAVQNLNLEKACRVNQNYSTEVCDSLIFQTRNGTDEEVEVQKLVAQMEGWRLPLSTAIPAIMILFIGAWSDRTGRRKPCMMFPIFGELTTAVGLMLCTYYFLQWPLEAAGLIEALPSALSGGYVAMFLGIFSYLADNTTPEDRTFRIGIVNMFISLALPVGTALSGTLLNSVGFYGVFAISIAFYVVAFVYGFLRIKDKKKTQENLTNTDACVAFFNWRHVLNTFMVVFKKRKSTKRLQVMLLVLSYILLAGPIHGSGGMQYLYVRRTYQFNEVDFSIFSAYSIVVNFFGMLFALSVLSKYFQMNDCLLAAIGCCSKVAASLVYAFAPSKYWLYLGPLVELIGGTSAIAMRSMGTKIVESDEIGKVNSVFGICESGVNVIYGPIFAVFYFHTVATFPGAFCLLSGLLLTPTIGLLLYMYKLQKIENVKLKAKYEDPVLENESSHL